MNKTHQISKTINYTKRYDTALWSIDCLYCKLHNPEKALDCWYDCDECNSEFNAQPKEYILKQRLRMKLIRNVLVVPAINIVLDGNNPEDEEIVNLIFKAKEDYENGDYESEEESEDESTEVELDQTLPCFYIKGVNELNEFMKNGRAYLEKEIGIEFNQNFCSAIQKKHYEDKDVGMNDLIFKIDFSKSTPTTKRGAYFLNILISGKYTLDELIGKAITNTLEKL